MAVRVEAVKRAAGKEGGHADDEEQAGGEFVPDSPSPPHRTPPAANPRLRATL